MTEIYLNSPWDNFRNLGNRSEVLAFSAIAALVLLIACINFTFLSTARMSLRTREVAMRKAIGARKSQLVLQFLGESSVLVLLAIALGLALVELVINNIDSRRELYARMPAFKEEVLRIPQVNCAGFSTWQPSQQNRGFGSYDLLGEGAANFSIARTGIGYD